MFYEIKETIRQIEIDEVNENELTVGCVTSEELVSVGKRFGFDEETIEASQKANLAFRTGVDVHDNYTFAELRIVNRDGSEDFISIYVKKNCLLIVDILDEDNSTINSFMKALKKYPCTKINEERLIYRFIESLLSDGIRISEDIRNTLTEMEETIVKGRVEEHFNIELLEEKKKILKYYNYYGQILDIVETFEENDNEILDEDNLIYVSNLSSKVTRLSDDMSALNNTADHIQDAYATYLDQKMNTTMKIFTIITTIFFPLTIIVGWYGMNFQNMPELTWKYGYLYVGILSVFVVVLLVVIGKKKKWF
ncbi:MAG: hypothetical protein KBS85_01445 [Lachnospiraceae bacterium]|nr:hypothetical protein [Candidatus Merdinaster equi]